MASPRTSCCDLSLPRFRETALEIPSFALAFPPIVGGGHKTPPFPATRTDAPSPQAVGLAAVMVHILALGLVVSTLRPHPLGHLTLLQPSRLPAETQLLGKLGLGPGLKTDWLKGYRKDWSPGGMGGVCRLGAGTPRIHAQVHIALRTSLKIHVQLNASLNKRKPPQSAVWAHTKKSGKTGGSRETQVRSHSLPKCSEEELGLPYKEYFPSSLEKPGENRPPTGVREYLGGGGGVAWRLQVPTGSRVLVGPAPGGGLLALRSGVLSGGLQTMLPLPQPLLKSWLLLPIMSSCSSQRTF